MEWILDTRILCGRYSQESPNKIPFQFLKIIRELLWADKHLIFFSQTVIVPKGGYFKSVFMKGTMESGRKTLWKEKTKSKGKEVLCLMSHDQPHHAVLEGKHCKFSNQFWVRIRLQNLTIWKCFQLLGNTHWPWRSYELGNKKRHRLKRYTNSEL